MFSNFFCRRNRDRKHIHNPHTSPWHPYTKPCRRPTITRKSLERREISSACSFWCVCCKRLHAPILTKAEFERCHISTSPSAAGLVLVDVSGFVCCSRTRRSSISRPHSRKEAKLDTKTKLYQLNELAGKHALSSLFSLNYVT
jgi:hypothetical protein